MKKLELKDIQHVALDLLIAFDEICIAQSLRYSLGGGSLLGAIRHGGFIPWDDDIDIMMPRPDYEAFLSYCDQNTLPFICHSLRHTVGYDDLFSRISDTNTIVKDDAKAMSYSTGVSIDIFPIDGLGLSNSEALKKFNQTKFSRELLIACRWKKYFRSKTRSILIEPIRFSLFFLSRFIDSRKLALRIDERLKKETFDSSAYAGCVCGVYREREIMPTKTFIEYETVKFEGHDFQAIFNYHAYLEKHYGDYMQMPPEHKRVSHHTAEFYWKEV